MLSERTRRSLYGLALALLAGLWLSLGRAAAAEPEIFELDLRLTGALRSATEPGPSLVLDLTRTGDRWERVWGVESDSRFPALHSGRVRQANIGDARITLEIAIEGRKASRVLVEVARAADGRLSGTYTLMSATGENKGTADGHVKPPRPPLPAGFVPVKLGEHPRLLCRASELPALREKAKTPFGQALLQKMGDEKAVDAIGAALRYQLTGDAEWATRARTLAERQMAGQGAYSARESKARHPEQVALSYDLCCDAWPADVKAQVVEYLAKTARQYMGRQGGNEHVCSNWNSRVYSGAGFAMLALWGEKGPQPPKPADAEAVPFWEDDVKDWKRLGEVNMDYERLFERTRYLKYLFCREATGTGGFRGECSHYGLLAAETSIEYAACYRRMFGRDLSPWNDLSWMVPRMIFGQDYPAGGGTPVHLDINGKNGINGDFFAYSFGFVPERWRGTVLWAWNRSLGISGPDGLAKPMAAQRGGDGDASAAWVFVSYPLDGKPQPPAETMPLTWEAPDHGYYGFRSGWTGKGDFVLQVHAKSHFTGGWSLPNAGTFRLYGRGQSWNQTSSERDGCVWEENRVMMPDEKRFDFGQGRVTYTDFKPDGSGAVSIEMDDCYGGEGGRLYTMYGNFRYPSGYKDLGVRALRALAVDYSGKCGAPCLFVLVDHLSGGQAKTWTWDLGDAALVPKVTIAGNTFTLPKGTATLRGTFIAPGQAALAPTVKTLTLGTPPRTEERKVPLLTAEGGDDFFLVATVQDAKNAPPEVRIEGTGLNAKVTVGRRRVSFDGAKIKIEDAE